MPLLAGLGETIPTRTVSLARRPLDPLPPTATLGAMFPRLRLEHSPITCQHDDRHNGCTPDGDFSADHAWLCLRARASRHLCAGWLWRVSLGMPLRQRVHFLLLYLLPWRQFWWQHGWQLVRSVQRHIPSNGMDGEFTNWCALSGNAPNRASARWCGKEAGSGSVEDDTVVALSTAESRDFGGVWCGVVWCGGANVVQLCAQLSTS